MSTPAISYVVGYNRAVLDVTAAFNSKFFGTYDIARVEAAKTYYKMYGCSILQEI